MNRYLTRLLLSLAVAFSVLVPAVPVLAATDPFDGDYCKRAPDSAICKATKDDPLTGPGGILQNAANLIALIGGIFAVIMIVLAGISYVTANGDNEQISKAKRTIIFSAVGLIILVMARWLVGYIVTEVVG
jgi:hypothetical protein